MKDKAILPTSAEITRRLQVVTELRNLCLSLGRAKRTAPIVGTSTSPGPASEQRKV